MTVVTRRSTPTPTLLETGFPVTKLHQLAISEGNSKRPIYQIHKWWARRLGSVFRAIILSSALPASESPKEFWEKYYNGLSLRGRTLYDPMMGGGASIVEGMRLGCKVIGADINPVAWFVTKEEVEPFDEKSVDRWYNDISARVSNEVRRLYTTKCEDGHEAEVVYAIWMRYIVCTECSTTVDLYSSHIVREKRVKTRSGPGIRRILLCPKCGEVFKSLGGVTSQCHTCGLRFDSAGDEGTRGCFICPSCGHKEKVTELVRRSGGPPNARLAIIQYSCSQCGIGFKKPDATDLELYEAATHEFEKRKRGLLFPRQKIPTEGRADRRPVSYGFRRYDQLFNPRQLLTLASLLKEIITIPDQSAREFLLLAFSSSLETNNVLCKYESKWGKTSALFGIPGYHVPYRFAENNLWGKGRGSFVRSYQKLKRGKNYARRPFELLFEDDNIKNQSSQKQYLSETVTSTISYSKDDGEHPLILCRDSRNARYLKSKTVDIVLSDPPYYDNLVYSELADFFYVWLRLGLKSDYPMYFSRESSKRPKEIVVNERSKKGEVAFVNSLTLVLRESRRVLKDEGLLALTFHHSNPKAWIGLKKAIEGAGLSVTATPVIRSEGKSGFRRGNINYDVCVVCRKSKLIASPGEITENAFAKLCLSDVEELYQRDQRINDSEVLTVVMGRFLKSNDSLAESVLAPQKIIDYIRSRLKEKYPEPSQRKEETLSAYGFAPTAV